MDPDSLYLGTASHFHSYRGITRMQSVSHPRADSLCFPNFGWLFLYHRGQAQGTGGGRQTRMVTEGGTVIGIECGCGKFYTI